MPHIVVVGSLNMDLVVRVPHMPAPGETILGSGFQTIPGGKGANQAVAAARMGAKVTMIGRVGKDNFGKSLIENLGKEGADINHVSTDAEVATGIAMITVDEAGQNSIVVASGANMSLTPEHILAAWENIKNIDAVVMPLEVSLDCVGEAVRLAKTSSATVVLNPAPAQLLSDDLLKQVDVLVPNESETSLLTGMSVDTLEQAKAAANQLLSKGTGAVVLTLGDRGAMYLSHKDDAQVIPAYSVNVVDTTAAGDAFVAALSVGIASGKSLADSTEMANAAGALTVTRMGAQPSVPTLAEVNKLLAKKRGEE